MYQTHPKALGALLMTLATACVFSVTTTSVAQVTTPLPKQGKTEAQCSFNGAVVEVLYREGKAPWVAFKNFSTQKVKALQKKLRKQGKSQKAIKEAVKKLKVKLAERDKKLLEQCRSQLGSVVTGPGDPGEGLVPIAKQGGYTLYVYQSSSVKHSFGSAISEKGAISGTLYKGDPALDPSSPSDGNGPGLRFYSHGTNPSSPFVWTQKGIKKACNECTGLTLGKLNDSQTLALGNKGIGIAGATTTSIVFNYATGSIIDLPLLNSRPILAGDINEAGQIMGSVQKADNTNDAVFLTSGSPRELSRSAIVTALDNAAKLFFEREIKKEMYDRQDLNECSDAEIETTTLIPGGHRRELAPSIFGLRLSDNGYLLGNIVDRAISRWNYVGECQSGTHMITPSTHTFVVKPNNSLQVIPSNALPLVNAEGRGFASGLAINNGGMIAGTGVNGTLEGFHIARLNAQRGDTEWQMSPINPGSYSGFLATDTNDRGTIVGMYSVDPSVPGMRACMVTSDNTIIDIGDFMGIKRDSGLVLEMAAGINNCQTIIGNAWNEKTKRNQLFLLAPDGCPIPS